MMQRDRDIPHTIFLGVIELLILLLLFVIDLHIGTASLVFQHKHHSSLAWDNKLIAAQLGSVLLSSTRMHSSRP